MGVRQVGVVGVVKRENARESKYKYEWASVAMAGVDSTGRGGKGTGLMDRTNLPGAFLRQWTLSRDQQKAG